MIAAEYWPEMPELWQQEADAQLTEKLYLSPFCEDIDFTDREREVAYWASQDMDMSAMCRALPYTFEAIKTLRRDAFRRVRHFIEDTALEPLTEEKAEESMTLHGLVYILLDSGHIPVGDAVEPIALLPDEAIFLKSLAANNGLGTSAKLIRVNDSTCKAQWRPALEEKMGANTTQGLVGNAFRMGLFVPSTLTRPFQLPQLNPNEGEKHDNQ